MDKTDSAKHFSSGLTCKTFYNRITKCYDYKPRKDYVKGISLIFEGLLKEGNGKPFIASFSDKFSSRAYVGRNYIISVDREHFLAICLQCAMNLDKLFSKVEVLNKMDKYNFKWRIKGFIHARIKVKNKEYNLGLSFTDRKLTEEDLDYFCLNNCLYNKSKGLSNDLLVMSVPQDLFYLVPYDSKDYTIKRGFAAVSKRISLKRRGNHCENCINSCKPLFHNGLSRLLLRIG